MRKAVIGVALALWAVPPAHAAAPAQRILFVSNRTGPTQIYAVDPSGKAPVGQLTFTPAASCDFPTACGAQRAIPSPDGRRVLFTTRYSVYHDGYRADAYALWAARADGRGVRRVSALEQETNPIGAAVWAPDSKRFAYVIVDRVSTVHVAAADATGDRIVRRVENSPAIGWTRDSRRIRVLGAVDPLSSPNGKWHVARTSAGLTVARVAPEKTWSVSAHTWGLPAWAPNSRYLAYPKFSGGVEILDVRTGHSRELTPDSAIDLAWAPDGQALAYRAVPTLDGRVLEPLDASGAGSELRTVTLTRRVKVVVSADGPFGGAVSFAWTRTKKASYRAPEAVDGFYTRSIVRRLAANGSRFAYATCLDAAVVSSSNGAVSTPFGQLRCSNNGPLVGTLAVGGPRVAFTTISGGNITSWAIDGIALEPTLQRFTVERSSETCCVARPAVAADGNFLVYSTRRWLEAGTLEWQIREIGTAGCECRFVTAFTQSTRDPLSVEVDGGRLLVKGRTWVQVYDRSGVPLVRLDAIPAPPPLYALDPTVDATLSGDDVVVHVGDTFHVYSVSGRSWGLSRPALGPRPELQDASRGLVAYRAAGAIHVLHLRAGNDKVVGHGTLARFMDDGLVYADGARIRVVPWASLP